MWANIKKLWNHALQPLCEIQIHQSHRSNTSTGIHVLGGSGVGGAGAKLDYNVMDGLLRQIQDQMAKSAQTSQQTGGFSFQTSSGSSLGGWF